METIGNRIKKLRTQKRLSLQEVADAISGSKGNLSNYENDKIKPSSEVLISLSNYFNVSIDYILLGKEEGFNIKTMELPITPQEKYILDLYRQLSERNKIKIEGILEEKVHQDKYETRVYKSKKI